MLLFLCRKSEAHTVLTAMEDQTQLLPDLGANHFLTNHFLPLSVSGKSHSGHLWETKGL